MGTAHGKASHRISVPIPQDKASTQHWVDDIDTTTPTSSPPLTPQLSSSNKMSVYITAPAGGTTPTGSCTSATSSPIAIPGTTPPSMNLMPMVPPELSLPLPSCTASSPAMAVPQQPSPKSTNSQHSPSPLSTLHRLPMLTISTAHSALLTTPPPSPPHPIGGKTCMGRFVLDVGTYGAAEGQFNEPQGIAIDTATGRVYVADTRNDRVQCFSTRGHFLSILGGKNEDIHASYDFKQPNSVGIDGSGDVYVSDTGHAAIVAFGAGDGRPRVVGTGLLQGGRLSAPRVSVNPSVKGQFFVSEPGSAERGYILAYRDGVHHGSSSSGSGSRRSSPLRSSSRASGSQLSSSASASSSSSSSSSSRHSSRDRSSRISGEYSFSLGTDVSPDQSMRQPQQSAVDHAHSLLYVCDAGNKRIMVYNIASCASSSSGSRGGTPPRTPPRSPHSARSSASPMPSPSSRNPSSSLSSISSSSSSSSSAAVPSSPPPFSAVRRFGQGLLQHPTGIAIGTDGYIYVSDRDANAIFVFSADGILVRTFGEAGTASGQLNKPSGLAFDSRQRLFVCNTGNSRITIFE